MEGRKCINEWYVVGKKLALILNTNRRQIIGSMCTCGQIFKIKVLNSQAEVCTLLAATGMGWL